MAPLIPTVAALLSVAHANRAELHEDSSMLQMPVTATDMAVDQATDECHCPAYYEEQCLAQADQGCVWSDAGDSNAPWCQCLNPPVERTEQHQQQLEDHHQEQADAAAAAAAASAAAQAAAAAQAEVHSIPEGWAQINENWNCAGSGSSSSEFAPDATNNQECAQACYAEGHVIAAFWHTTRNVCRCYDTCDGGGDTSMPSYPNIVMQKNFYLVSPNMKCPHGSGDRLFRSPESGSNDISLAACRLECQNTETCAHYSWGQHGGGNVCMGCVTLQNEEFHEGFNTYDLEHSTPPLAMVNNWNFEEMTVGGTQASLAEGKWIHFLDDGNSGLQDTAIPGWQQMGTVGNAAGLYNSPNNEIAAEGTHVLFLNRGDDNNYVYQDLLEPFTATINIEAAVGGGNGDGDGGYRFGLYSEDGTLLQEVAAGVNGAPDTQPGGQYILTHMSVSAGDHAQFVGQHLQLRLMKNKSAQGHYHYIRFT